MDCIGTVLSVRGANYPLTIYSQGVVTKHLQHVIMCSILTLYCCIIFIIEIGIGIRDWDLRLGLETGILN